MELYGRAEVTGVLGNKISTNSTATNVLTDSADKSSRTQSASGNFAYVRADKARAAIETFNPVLVPTSKPSFRIDDGNSNGDGSSRIGFRGTEDLGGGLKAVFQFEAGINVDDGSSGNGGGNLFSRTAMVGVDGGFGRVTFGRQLTPSFLVYNSSTAMGTMNGLSDTSALLRIGTVRESNSALYVSPDFSGVKFSAMVAAPETRTQTSLVGSDSFAAPGFTSASSDTLTSEVKPSTTINLALNYANGPLGLGFGYEQGKSVISSNLTSVNPAVAVVSSSTNAKTNTWNMGASYDLGMVKPYLNYANNKTTGSSTAVDSAALTSGFGDSSVKRNVMTLGFTTPVGTGIAFAEFADAKSKDWADSSTKTVAGNTKGTNNLAGLSQSDKSKAFTVGYRYPLSKRTWVQAAYGQLKTTQESTYTVTQPAGSTESDVTNVRTVVKNSGLAMTLSHNF